MAEIKHEAAGLDFRPLTKDRWNDFEKLFGKRGACGGCWCMWWRVKRSQFNEQKGEGNRQAMKDLVDSGETPGILAYAGDRAVGWCALAPRDNYPVLNNSRILGKVDDLPVWSIVCFFIDKKYRGQGLTVQLLRSAIDFVGEQGGAVLEGYPYQPKKEKMPAVFAYTGLFSAFKKAGFVEAARRSPTRPVMRYYLKR